MHLHHYNTQTVWTGNRGQGTGTYKGYDRAHEISVDHKPIILGSSDPSFQGDRTRYNPEELFLASLSSCHMLWYLHLCSVSGVVVMHYQDEAKGTMNEAENGGGHFEEVVLQPIVTVKKQSMLQKAMEIHHKANELCFIANSVNFPVLHKPTFKVHEEIEKGA